MSGVSCVKTRAEISISPEVVEFAGLSGRIERHITSLNRSTRDSEYTVENTQADRQVLGKSNRAVVMMMMMMMCDGTVAAGQQSSGFSSSYRFRSAVSKQEITFTCRGIQSTKGEDERNRSIV